MIEIRWAQLEDIQELGLVYSEAYRNAYQGIIPDEYLNQVTPKVREATEELVVLNEELR